MFGLRDTIYNTYFTKTLFVQEHSGIFLCAAAFCITEAPARLWVLCAYPEKQCCESGGEEWSLLLFGDLFLYQAGATYGNSGAAVSSGGLNNSLVAWT